MLERLTPRPFRLLRVFGVKAASVIEQAQLLLDARNSGGVVASHIASLLEEALPIIEPPDGYLGDLMVSSNAELRGRDGLVALIGPASAFVGTLPELLAAARRTVVSTCDRLASEGYAMDAARERRAMERGRPKLRAVEAGKSA